MDDKKHRFRHLYSCINLEMLYKCFHQLKAKAAAGVDGVSYDDYAQDLDANLRSLLGRLRSKCYRAPKVRRTYIPKAGGNKYGGRRVVLSVFTTLGFVQFLKNTFF